MQESWPLLEVPEDFTRNGFGKTLAEQIKLADWGSRLVQHLSVSFPTQSALVCQRTT